MNKKPPPSILGLPPEDVRPATPAEAINALSANQNAVRNQVQSIESNLTIWSLSLIEVLDETLPGFREKFLKRKMRYDVRETMANQEVNKQMGNLQAYRVFTQKLEVLKKSAKEGGMLSDFHKGERLYEKWKKENLEVRPELIKPAGAEEEGEDADSQHSNETTGNTEG